MANPSTTGPSGIGTEVLRRKGIIHGTASTNSGRSTLVTVGTDMIVTVLSITITNNSGSAGKKFDLEVKIDGGTAMKLLANVPIPTNDTFVFNDRIVLTETDVLDIVCDSTDHDVYISYIEQEFE
tara:strand:+ start:39 stop:413 length:375 start_codon:yes stop_codon:yes gene_type:complete